MFKRVTLLTVTAGLVLAGLTACAPAAPKVTWNYVNLPITPPGAGVRAGHNAELVYSGAGVPSGGRLVLQQLPAVKKLGETAHWTTVSRLAPLVGQATVVRPALGADTYRVAIINAQGKVLAAVARNLFVYQAFSLSTITTRPVQTATQANGKPFPWIFRAEVFIPHTSCRSVLALTALNLGNRDGIIELTHTVRGKDPVKDFHVVADGIGRVVAGSAVGITPGEDFDIRNVETSGSDVFGNGTLLCFTASGKF